ncbi:MAG: hypothetical protein M3072_07940 [Candidatus Dormibacteraeota bacterium]|nr:hypothetical protein [Candidatus Dormibacteraeota bacterium]
MIRRTRSNEPKAALAALAQRLRLARRRRLLRRARTLLGFGLWTVGAGLLLALMTAAALAR